MKKLKTISKTNLKFQFTMVILAEIAISTFVAFLLMHQFTRLSSDNILIPMTLWQILLSVLIGGTIYDYLNRLIFNPISKLSRAMSQVSDGDFSVRLKSDSSIDEILNLYCNFNLMVQELNNTEILQTDFVSNVSHEFKTPISAIEGYAMLLQDEGCTAEERNSYTDKILFSTNRLSKLVGNILLLSRLDNQTILSRKSVFRLDEQIRQSILLLEPKWENKNLDFDVELEELNFTGNEGVIIHIWNNVIGNAIKFTPDGGYLGIKMQKVNENAKVIIEDSGPGIVDSDKKHVFDKFYQSDSSHTEKGNGLGLALVKRIVDLYSGSIEIQDRAGGGAIFIISLPLNS